MTARSAVRGLPPEAKSDSSQAIAMYAASMNTSTIARTGSSRTAPAAICTAAASCERLAHLPTHQIGRGGGTLPQNQSLAPAVCSGFGCTKGAASAHAFCSLALIAAQCVAHPAHGCIYFILFYLHISFVVFVVASCTAGVANNHR